MGIRLVRPPPEGYPPGEAPPFIGIVDPVPTKSPWLNPMAPRWVHAKRKVVEANGLLAAGELAQRVCDQFGCQFASPSFCARTSLGVSAS